MVITVRMTYKKCKVQHKCKQTAVTYIHGRPTPPVFQIIDNLTRNRIIMVSKVRRNSSGKSVITFEHAKRKST